MADPKSDAEELVDAKLFFGREMLETYGEFYPYGAAMTPDGEVVSVTAYDGDEHPRAQDVIAPFKGRFFDSQAKDGKYKATALFFDVLVTPPGASDKSDAIAVALDHRDNYSVIVFYPYELEGGEIRFGKRLLSRVPMRYSGGRTYNKALQPTPFGSGPASPVTRRAARLILVLDRR